MSLKNIEFDNKNGGRIIDDRFGIFFPWYVSSFLEVLVSWDIKDWKVFEYGGGDSTNWWRKNAKEVISVDSSQEWSKKIDCHFSNDKEDFIRFPSKFVLHEKFDCIIIDGEPVEWRDDCVKFAFKCLKVGGTIIIDNYKQASIGLNSWPKSEQILKKMSGQIFSQLGHKDWKTGYWIK